MLHRTHRNIDLICEVVHFLIEAFEGGWQRRHEAEPRGVELAGRNCIEARIAAQKRGDLHDEQGTRVCSSLASKRGHVASLRVQDPDGGAYVSDAGRGERGLYSVKVQAVDQARYQVHLQHEHVDQSVACDGLAPYCIPVMQQHKQEQAGPGRCTV